MGNNFIFDILPANKINIDLKSIIKLVFISPFPMCKTLYKRGFIFFRLLRIILIECRGTKNYILKFDTAIFSKKNNKLKLKTFYTKILSTMYFCTSMYNIVV